MITPISALLPSRAVWKTDSECKQLPTFTSTSHHHVVMCNPCQRLVEYSRWNVQIFKALKARDRQAYAKHKIRYFKSASWGKCHFIDELYLKLAGSFKDSLDIWVCEVGSAGVGVVQEHRHCRCVQAFYFHPLLMTLPQTVAKHRPRNRRRVGTARGGNRCSEGWRFTVLPEVLTGSCEHDSVAGEVVTLNTQHHIGELSPLP